MTSIPVHFSESPGNVRLLPPNLGEHSLEILSEVGYDAETAARLSQTLPRPARSVAAMDSADKK